MALVETAPAPAPPRARRRLRNREALLDAALALFQAQGLKATKLEDICARADVSPRTFFNHFETREHLYRALAERRAVQFEAAVDAATADPRPLAARLRDLFAAIGAYLDARPPYRELVGAMLQLGVDGSSEVARERRIGRALLRFVRDGVRRGEIATRHAPETLADLAIGALVAGITNWSASDGYRLEHELARAADALLELYQP